jgi:hypothetical protein
MSGVSGKGDNSGALCQGFRWLCNQLIRKARTHATENQEIPPHLRQVLEACFDKYDEYQRLCQMSGEEQGMLGLRQQDGLGMSEAMCLHSTQGNSSQHQLRDFNELAVSKNGYRHAHTRTYVHKPTRPHVQARTHMYVHTHPCHTQKEKYRLQQEFLEPPPPHTQPYTRY